MSCPSVEKRMLVTKEAKRPRWNLLELAQQEGQVLGKAGAVEPIGKDGAAEKPSRDGTQSQVHVEACKSGE